VRRTSTGILVDAYNFLRSGRYARDSVRWGDTALAPAALPPVDLEIHGKAAASSPADSEMEECIAQIQRIKTLELISRRIFSLSKEFVVQLGMWRVRPASALKRDV
jgi:hypothetical protein